MSSCLGMLAAHNVAVNLPPVSSRVPRASLILILVPYFFLLLGGLYNTARHLAGDDEARERRGDKSMRAALRGSDKLTFVLGKAINILWSSRNFLPRTLNAASESLEVNAEGAFEQTNIES